MVPPVCGPGAPADRFRSLSDIDLSTAANGNVGQAPRVHDCMKCAQTMPHPPRAFLADRMLGRLARWLRIMGHDTAYERALPDDDLIEQALREDRWLLTRDG